MFVYWGHVRHSLTLFAERWRHAAWPPAGIPAARADGDVFPVLHPHWPAVQTGGDWFNYQDMLDAIAAEDFRGSLSVTDPGFGLVGWISSQLGLGLNGPTTVCGMILMYGLVRFCRDLPDPWLALAAAVPYLLIVVGMGYIRQGAAIGFILLALRQFERGDMAKFLVRLGFSLLFHISASAFYRWRVS